jgi:hypothetical protein
MEPRAAQVASAPALTFAVAGARVEPYAAAPTITLVLRVGEAGGGAVEGAALRCQLRLEPQRRRYQPAEEASLTELFGATSRWRQTLRPLAWTETALLVPPFSGATENELPIACSYDLEVSAGKYLHALVDGEVPVRLLFRGMVFARGPGGLEVMQLPWDKEALWALPVRLWREAIDGHFPGAGWLRLRRDTLDALVRFKGGRALTSWDGVIETLLAEARRP